MSMLRFVSEGRSCHVPDGLNLDSALARCTHLGIGAHQDDLEFMAFHGIIRCLESEADWFGGVICTDGGGSARVGPFANYSDEQMKQVRVEEQNRAADLGRYGAMIQLGHASQAVKDAGQATLTDDLTEILRIAKPRVVYTHNPADKHESHIGVFWAVLAALRRLPAEERPEMVLGCEVWRDLDWLPDAEKVVLDVSGHDELAERLNGLFESQIAGGKRYDLAVLGRRFANATFFDAHSVDGVKAATYAMDLTPLVRDDGLDPVEYVGRYLQCFAGDVAAKLEKQRRT